MHFIIFFDIFKRRSTVKNGDVMKKSVKKRKPMQLHSRYRILCLIIGLLPILVLSGWLLVVAKEQWIWILIEDAVLLFMLFCFTKWGVDKLIEPIYSIREDVSNIQQGDWTVEISDENMDVMDELRVRIDGLLHCIKELTDANLKHEILVKNTEIRALQNQINAHFIYNVLESIKMLAEIDEKYDISDAITALGKLLRYSMRWTKGNVTVADELDYIRNYLSLINLRVDYEIYLSVKLPAIIKKQEIPKMSLQPIVENAIYHGIEPMAEDTNIYIKGIVEGDDCIIEITDAGRGMTEEQVNNLYRRLKGEIETSGGSGNGIGLKNVQDRIKMSFGEEYGLEIASKPGCYTKVSVRIPKTYEEIPPIGGRKTDS